MKPIKRVKQRKRRRPITINILYLNAQNWVNWDNGEAGAKSSNPTRFQNKLKLIDHQPCNLAQSQRQVRTSQGGGVKSWGLRDSSTFHSLEMQIRLLVELWGKYSVSLEKKQASEESSAA
jgi:hypothetical protein